MASIKTSCWLLVVCLLVSMCCGASVFRKERSLAETDSTQTPKDICIRSTICGWAVYHRFSREIDYFVKNKCECPEGKKCIRADDDISQNHYIYRCKDPKKDTES